VIDLQQEVAVVTGGGSGIGRATAVRLAKAGATVAAADIDFDGAKETAGIASAAGAAGAVRPFYVDITETASVADLCDGVVAELGTPSVLANVAGWEEIIPFIETERAFWEKVLSINLLGHLSVTHAFLGGMIKSGRGRIVNVSSDAGRNGSSGETPYASAKGGIIAFTKSLAREMARHQITVNCVCPGPTETPLYQTAPEKYRAALIRAVPLGRVGQPDDIAGAVGFFASDLASFITGQVLSVSGGITMND
jgi:2-hydroxycyclohexanecarboxyl-CoA dehydrogenase